MKKKIAQVVESFGYGTAKSVKQLCSLLKRDYDITVYYGHRDGVEVELQDLDADIRWVPLPKRGGIWGHLCNIWFLLQNVDAATTVVHGHSTYGGVYAKILGLVRRKTRILYSPRGYSFLREDHGRLARVVFKLFERLTSPLCQTVACGPSERKIAESISSKVSEIGNGWKIPHDVDTERVGKGVLIVGRISIQKGFDTLVNLAKQMPEVTFHWVGSAEVGDEFLLNDVPENISLTPFLPHSEVLERIQQCRFVLLPSRWEGLSRFLIESCTAGKAIVTSCCPANVDCLALPASPSGQFANGYACQGDEEYISAVRRLLADDQLLRTMQAASFQHATEHFDIEKIGRHWRELYDGGSTAKPAEANLRSFTNPSVT